MSSTHKNWMLRCIAAAPRTFKYFSEGEVHATIAARHLASYLAELQADGWITQYEDYYFPTEAGKALASKQPEIAQPKTWGPCSTQGSYVPKKWSVREGADQHLECRSLGMGA